MLSFPHLNEDIINDISRSFRMELYPLEVMNEFVYSVPSDDCVLQVSKEDTDNEEMDTSDDVDLATDDTTSEMRREFEQLFGDDESQTLTVDHRSIQNLNPQEFQHHHHQEQIPHSDSGSNGHKNTDDNIEILDRTTFAKPVTGGSSSSICSSSKDPINNRRTMKSAMKHYYDQYAQQIYGALSVGLSGESIEYAIREFSDGRGGCTTSDMKEMVLAGRIMAGQDGGYDENMKVQFDHIMAFLFQDHFIPDQPPQGRPLEYDEYEKMRKEAMQKLHSHLNLPGGPAQISKVLDFCREYDPRHRNVCVCSDTHIHQIGAPADIDI